jgi:hypothetical protein
MRIQRRVRRSMSNREHETGRACSGLGVQRHPPPIQAVGGWDCQSVANADHKTNRGTGTRNKEETQLASSGSTVVSQRAASMGSVKRPTKGLRRSVGNVRQGRVDRRSRVVVVSIVGECQIGISVEAIG